MSGCHGSTEALTADGTGSITELSCDCLGTVVALDCCPDPPAPLQDLVKRWKNLDRSSFTTVLDPFGVMSFSNSDLATIIGPPEPGGSDVITTRPVDIPPLPPITPTPDASTPVDGGAAD